MIRPLLPWLAAVAVLAAVSAFLFGGSAMNYDTQWALSWGQALARGDQPDLDIDGAPTSKPLVTAFVAVAQTLAGDATPDVLHALAHVAFAALLVLAFAVTTRLSGWAAGLVAAGMIAIASPIHMNTALAFQDVATAALLLLAVLLELQRPRRGAAPLLALAVAGLMRPEAWGLAAAYWLWCALDASGPQRLRLALLAVLGPALWMGSDLLFTGDPLLSLNRTRAGAEVAQRVTGLANAPAQLDTNLRATIRAAGLGAALLGAALTVAALVWRRRAPAAVRAVLDATDRRLAVVLALAALLVVAFFALATSELSLLDRYTIPLAAALAVLAGHAAGGWLRVAGGPMRVAWAAAGAAIVLALATTVDDQRLTTRNGLRFADNREQLLDQLEALIASAPARRALDRCAADAVASYRMVAVVAYPLDRPPRSLAIAPDPQNGRSLAWIAPITERAFTDFGELQRKFAPPPAGFRRAAANHQFAVFTRGCAADPARRAGRFSPGAASRRSPPSAPAGG